MQHHTQKQQEHEDHCAARAERDPADQQEKRHMDPKLYARDSEYGNGPAHEILSFFFGSHATDVECGAAPLETGREWKWLTLRLSEGVRRDRAVPRFAPPPGCGSQSSNAKSFPARKFAGIA